MIFQYTSLYIEDMDPDKLEKGETAKPYDDIIFTLWDWGGIKFTIKEKTASRIITCLECGTAIITVLCLVFWVILFIVGIIVMW